MIKQIHLENYRSFVDAHVDLAEFTLVLGANGAGKTNFLRAFVDCGAFLIPLLRPSLKAPAKGQPLPKHFNGADRDVTVTFFSGTKSLPCSEYPSQRQPGRGAVELFRLQPERISASETTVPHAFVASDGGGTTQSLESLKNGDQEAMFDAAHRALISYVPEIEKLSFANVQSGQKQMQVRERGIRGPVRADQLSDGTLLIIGLLAIIYQPIKPPVICLEDIDRGMHPRVFEQMVKLMQLIAREQDVQIIATTHNPYLVDCFQDEPEAVVIVEKKDGASTLDTLAQKLEGLDYDNIKAADMPLGNLWFSGFVGGVPEFLHAKRQ
ncbi:MAG TPA: AAA family ATPase [Candidatus Eisenbacteria bacterium]|nr:AAA family ATPase [Candidatus Eisenbacteria bacterium]